MVNLTFAASATALLLGSLGVTALPTDRTLLAREAEFHGHPVEDASVAPLPHGWYGHDATTPSERASRLMARDAAADAAARVDSVHPPLTVKRDHEDSGDDEDKRTNHAHSYDEHGNMINERHARRDYPAGFDPKTKKIAKRFADAGADPSVSWFPMRAPRLEERIANAIPDALRKIFKPREAEPRPIACAEHNMQCRSVEEKQAMADALSGTSRLKY